MNTAMTHLHPSTKDGSDLHCQYQIDVERLEFPQDIAHIIGLSKERINWMKRRGCKFYGRKTKIRWINEFIEAEVEAA